MEAIFSFEHALFNEIDVTAKLYLRKMQEEPQNETVAKDFHSEYFLVPPYLEGGATFMDSRHNSISTILSPPQILLSASPKQTNKIDMPVFSFCARQNFLK